MQISLAVPRTAPSIFSRLCHEVTELEHIERAMEHSALQLALAAVIVRLDALIDDTVGLEAPQACAAED